MGLKIDRARALAILESAASLADAGKGSPVWSNRVVALSEVAEHGRAKTHIAFLGTALLAKATELRVDPFSIKAGAGSPGSYSARGLAHEVLVPNAARLGIDLGRSGREPLNNQPYFRSDRVSSTMKVRGNAAATLEVVLNLLEAMQEEITTPDEGLAALASFIIVRRQYRPAYAEYAQYAGKTLEEISVAAEAMLERDPEGGRIAQAIVAGIMDAAFGIERVSLTRVNDPDRRHPADVCISADSGGWSQVFEVRHKPVTTSDVNIFLEKAARAGARKAGVIALSREQDPSQLVHVDIRRCALQLNVYFQAETNIADLIKHASFWRDRNPTGEDIHRHIYERLIKIEASEEAVERWLNATGGEFDNG